MVFDDTADDGKTQSGAAPLGGEVRQKEPLLDLGSDAVSGVGDDDLDGIAFFDQGGGDDDLFQQRVVHGLGGVVDQVGDGALDGFRIGLHLRQVRGQESLHPNSVEPAISGWPVWNL